MFLQLFKFAIVGMLATFVHAGLYLLFILQSVNPSLSNLLAFLVAFIVSFLGHSCWTFLGREPEGRWLFQAHKRSFIRFFAIAATGYLVNALFVITTEVFEINPAYAMAPMVTITPLLTFALSKKWAFAARIN